MNTPGVVRQAIVLVNRGEPPGLPEWAQIAAACRDAAGHGADGAVELAAAVSRAVAGGSHPHPLADAVRAWPDARVEQVRIVLAMATHAARRGEQAAVWDALLAGVERAALSPEPAVGVSDLDSALDRWRNVVAEAGAGTTRSLAAAIGQQQIGLLTVTRDLAARIQPDESGRIDTERLLAGLDACRDGWRQAITRWRTAPPGPLPTRADATAVSLTAVELRDALLSRPPSAATLASLVRSGVGGNLLITAVLNPDPTGVLTATARSLDALTARVGEDSPAFTLAPSVASAVAEPSRQASRPGPPAQAADRMAAGSVSKVGTLPETPAGEVVALTAEVERELAGRRDAGVVAQAALDGVPAARALMAGASEAELGRLAWQGWEATGVLVASAQTAIWSRVHRYRTDLDDRFATAALAVADAVHRWDPKRARWSTYAIKVSDWALSSHYRTELGLPRPVRMDVDNHRTIDEGAIDPRRLVSDLPDPADTAATRVDGAQAAALVQRLPWPDNQILSEAMGFGGQPATIAAIARRIDMPHSTVSSHFQRGLDQVRRQLGVDR